MSAELLATLVAPIDRSGLRYMVTGGVASVFYGDPRFTRDVDVVVELEGDEAGKLAAAYDPDEFYVPPLEVLREESMRRSWGHFNLIHRPTGLRADVYVHAGDELEAWGLSRRRSVSLGDASVWFAPPEYVIVRKLEYFRDSGSDRHLRDVSMMLAVSGPTIDDAALVGWVEARGLQAQWETVKSFRPGR